MERIPDYHFCAIVLGLSGHGKSALLSSLYNYLSGNSPENFEIPFPVSGGSRSCTKAVKYYPIVSIHDRKTYLFIDTPGFDDTEGTQSREFETLRDIKQNLNKIKKINAVIYVKNSTVNRQYDSFRKASTLILRILNNDIKEISIAVLTYMEKNDDILCDFDEGNGKYINQLLEQTEIRFDEHRIFCVNNRIHNYTKNQIQKNVVSANKYWNSFCNRELSPIIESIKKKEIENTRLHQINNFEQRILNKINETESMLKIIEGTTDGYALKKSNNLYYICNECHRNCIDNPGRVQRFILSIKKFFKKSCDICYHRCNNHRSDYYYWEFGHTYNNIYRPNNFVKENKSQLRNLYEDLKIEIKTLKNIEPDYNIENYISELSFDKTGKIYDFIQNILNNKPYQY